jgi:hypothetical protein
VEDRWHTVSEFEGKYSPETLDIRIRDPVKPEIPIEVTGSGKVNSHMYVGVSAYRASGVGKTSCLVSRVRNHDREISDRGKRKVSIDWPSGLGDSRAQ